MCSTNSNNKKIKNKMQLCSGCLIFEHIFIKIKVKANMNLQLRFFVYFQEVIVLKILTLL